jgi:hypothetical protein
METRASSSLKARRGQKRKLVTQISILQIDFGPNESSTRRNRLRFRTHQYDGLRTFSRPELPVGASTQRRPSVTAREQRLEPEIKPKQDEVHMQGSYEIALRIRRDPGLLHFLSGCSRFPHRRRWRTLVKWFLDVISSCYYVITMRANLRNQCRKSIILFMLQDVYRKGLRRQKIRATKKRWPTPFCWSLPDAEAAQNEARSGLVLSLPTENKQRNLHNSKQSSRWLALHVTRFVCRSSIQ